MSFTTQFTMVTHFHGYPNSEFFLIGDTKFTKKNNRLHVISHIENKKN